jgi:hypothetical protein
MGLWGLLGYSAVARTMAFREDHKVLLLSMWSTTEGELNNAAGCLV